MSAQITQYDNHLTRNRTVGRPGTYERTEDGCFARASTIKQHSQHSEDNGSLMMITWEKQCVYDRKSKNLLQGRGTCFYLKMEDHDEERS